MDSANKRLQFDLDVVDSLYQVNPGMREGVIKTEEEKKRNFKLLQKAREMESAAREMKSKVYK